MISYTFNSTTISILCMFTLNLNLMKYEINQFMHPSICLFICNILLSIDKVDKVWLTVLVAILLRHSLTLVSYIFIFCLKHIHKM